ncbi:hypothetical protein ACFVYA_41380 [Amycolatopsis sp. NPDC058278]|uniref:hypothetical protein n=1 Tax=unclassified Amycolatopsis TaxID=2618356 RepID=UPI00255BD3F7|nr:hypothetical protein [Amycolatopsis sp. DG1A-15b]WIX90017.1 hypothetical protein QRY02_06100 [Amycolatopsis sp. DG1A-15b]
MSTPEIDPVTAESMEADADIAGEHTEPTFRDQEPQAGDSDEEDADRGGMPSA